MSGKLTLYHGTGSIFLDSIKKHGLGGKNIIEELNVINALNSLIQLCSRHVPEEYNDLNKWNSYGAIANQTNSGFMNFQHGNVYLTPSFSRAVGYATEYELASEAITHTNRLLKLIQDNNVPISPSFIKKYDGLFALFDKKSNPIIIEVSISNFEELVTESGSDSKIEYEDAISTFNEFGRDAWELREFGFRLVDVISFDKLTIHSL
jgi:hypothetical protein